MSYRGGLDVSRKSGDVVFAPSWFILTPALELRRRGLETAETWQAYTDAYVGEMRQSWKKYHDHWLTQLVDGAVFKCYCAKRHLPRCHRVILADLFVKVGTAAGILVVYGGEVS